MQPKLPDTTTTAPIAILGQDLDTPTTTKASRGLSGSIDFREAMVGVLELEIYSYRSRFRNVPVGF